MDGILLVDKPPQMTSHDVVDVIRAKTGIQKVGHTGTLDPHATGLIILCIGKATRLADFLLSLDKTYEGVMRLGLVSDTHDLQGKIIEERTVPGVTEKKLKQVCKGFIGEIQQIPPMVSAIKVGGERLYKLARKGITIEREPRTIMVYEFTILKVNIPDVHFRISCSRGTYVRTICHDIGEKLGCGAVLAELRRTKIGKFRVEDAVELEKITGPEIVEEHVVPMGEVLDFPKVTVNSVGEKMFAKGRKLTPGQVLNMENGTSEWVQVFNSSGVFLGLAKARLSAIGPFIEPKRVFV